MSDLTTPRPTRGSAGTLHVAPEFAASLAAARLDNVAAVMATRTGRLLRALRERENWRIDLPRGHGPPRGAFLKKHHTRRWTDRLRMLLGLPLPDTPGRVEASNIRQLEAAGIPVMRLVAFGERIQRSGLVESFLLTEELVGYVQLDHYLRGRFAELNKTHAAGCVCDRNLRALLRRVAELAQRFHQRGYNHRDLYCCHFFVREVVPGDFDVRLIDLQRVQHRMRRRRRWIVKDLAQLAYSAPRERVSCAQRMAFFKAYLGVNRLRPADKRLLRSVLRKQALMEFKLGPHP